MKGCDGFFIGTWKTGTAFQRNGRRRGCRSWGGEQLQEACHPGGLLGGGVGGAGLAGFLLRGGGDNLVADLRGGEGGIARGRRGGQRSCPSPAPRQTLRVWFAPGFLFCGFRPSSPGLAKREYPTRGPDGREARVSPLRVRFGVRGSPTNAFCVARARLVPRRRVASGRSAGVVTSLAASESGGGFIFQWSSRCAGATPSTRLR